MSAPLTVNTKDGVCWTRRTVTSGGIALYAPEGVCKCPEFVMATLAELAEHGITGSADVLPVPVGPQSQPLSAARLAEAEERAAHLYEFGNDVPADEWNRLAGDDVPVLVAEIRRQAAVIAELNESVSTAAEALRARPSCPCPPEGRPHQVGCPQAEVPVPAVPDRLTQAFAPVPSLRAQLEDPHDGPLAHRYRLGRELDDPARCLTVHAFSPRDGWRMVCDSCDHGKDAECHRVGA